MGSTDQSIPQSHEAITLLRSLVALMVDEREQRLVPEMKRTEVVLSEAGLTNAEIGALMGKTTDAVRMAISRAKQG